MVAFNTKFSHPTDFYRFIYISYMAHIVYRFRFQTNQTYIWTVIHRFDLLFSILYFILLYISNDVGMTALIARFMGPIWGRQDPGGPHVGPMNSVIWVYLSDRSHSIRSCSVSDENNHVFLCLVLFLLCHPFSYLPLSFRLSSGAL